MFIALLADAGLDVTALEIADCLWLAQYLPQEDAVGGPPAPPPVGEPAPHPTPTDTDPLDPGGPDGFPDETEADGAGPGPVPQDSPLYLPAEDASRPGLAGAEAGGQLRVPESTALPGSLALTRSLRSLRVRAANPHSWVLDETATADESARAGSLVPVFDTETERDLSAALVVDTGPSMAIWSMLADELAALLQRTGAFRDVRRWTLRTAPDRAVHVCRESEDDHGLAVPRHPAEVLDPTGRQVIFFLTDGTGPAWRSPRLRHVLRLWCRGGPMTILQPLPQQLWRRTALAPVLGRLSSPRQAAPNSDLTFVPRARSRRGQPADYGSIVYVPILEIAPDWLDRWASFVAGPGGTRLHCAALPLPASRPSHQTGTSSVPVPEGSGTREPGARGGNAEERVRQFVMEASPSALQLASYLAAVELALPVMRYVQAAMLPDSRPSHLAEFLLGGLVTTSAGPKHPAGQQQWQYRFAPGVRTLLLNGLGRADAHRVRASVSGMVSARLGRASAGSFSAVAAGTIPDSGTLTRFSHFNRPFAFVPEHVIERMTGHFTTTRTPLSSSGPDDLDQAISQRKDYEETGNVRALDDAIGKLTEMPATAVPEVPSPQAARVQHELATTLGLRHARTGSETDLLSAIEAATAAVAAAPPGSPEYPRYAGTAGELLLRRWEVGGADGDLEAALSWLRAAASFTDTDGETRAELLAVLGGALREQAVQPEAGNPRELLDESVRVLRDAIALTAADPDQVFGRTAVALAVCQTKLGATLASRARLAIPPEDLSPPGTEAPRTETPENSLDDLTAAVDAYLTAINLLPDDNPRIPGCLTARAGVYRDLFRITEEDRFLRDAIVDLRNSIDRTFPDDPALPARQADLAGALRSRFAQYRRRFSLDEAISLLSAATENPAQDDTTRARCLGTLAACREDLYGASRTENDAITAADAYQRAAAAAESVHGHAHPDTLSAYVAQARLLHAAGLDDEARAVLDPLVPDLKRSLGARHPLIQQAQELAEVLSR